MANEGYSILDVINDEYGVILTRNGCVSVAFRMYNPECYSLHRTDLEERNARLYQAFKHLPSGSFVHKQDVFLKREYVHELEGDSFIDKAEQRHFSGREYLEHDCLLIFTLSGLSSLAASYNANPFSYRERLHVSDREKLTEFLEGVNSAIGVINSIRDTRLERMAAASLREYVIRYINFFPRADCDRDIHFSGEITVDREKARCYTVCDGDYLPDRTVRSDVEDTTLPVSGCSLYMAELEGLGVHLHCNHAVNQILYFEGSEKLYEEFSRRVAVYRTNKGWDRAMLEPKADELENMQKEIMEERQLLCRANFSVMIWDDSPELLDRAEKKLREYLTVSDFKFYIPSYEHLANIYLASVPGQEKGLDSGFLFLTPLSLALCLFINYTTFTPDEEGVYFNDRIYQIPLKKDIWDAKKKRIPARNGIVVASTGGGKSVLTLNIVQQLIEQGYIVVVVEFGYSFGQLCKLYPEISLHVDYDGETPLGLNPFDLEGRSLDNNKIEVLSGIVQRFWRRMFGKDEEEQSVALTKFIQDYYATCLPPHSFPSFYRHVTEHYEDICRRKDVDPNYFDLSSFRLICSEFLPGERYANVFRKLGLSFPLEFTTIYETEQPDRSTFIQYTGEKGDFRWVGIAPFAKHVGKMYPLSKMEEVIVELSRQEKIKLFLFGGGKEEIETLAVWEKKYPNTTALAGKLKLNGELALISQLDVMISMDSANMHMASLTNTPVVSIWGATHPWGGFLGWNQSAANIIQTDLPCRPCSIFGHKPCIRQDYACLNRITPQSIISHTLKVLNSTASH